MRAFILAQVPHPHFAASIACYQLALIGMDDHIINRVVVIVVALDTGSPRVPNLHRPILRTRDHPLTFTVKCDTSNIPAMAIECQDRRRIRGTNVEELDVLVASCREPAFVGGDAQPVDLRVWVLNGTRTDAGESFPESDCMVVAGCTKDYGHVFIDVVDA